MADHSGSDRLPKADDRRQAAEFGQADASGDVSRQSGQSGTRDPKKGKVEKVLMSATEKTKKTIVDIVDMSREEPQTEVERMIQQKLLMKKQSGHSKPPSN